MEISAQLAKEEYRPYVLKWCRNTHLACLAYPALRLKGPSARRTVSPTQYVEVSR